MIATRFRSIVMVGGCAAAALGFYLISQTVASERAAVEQLDRQIEMARIDIRKLQTEIGTRSRLPVLEQWNSSGLLLLSAPASNQYLHGEIELASFEAPVEQGAEIRPVSATIESGERAAPPAIVRVAAVTRPVPADPVAPATARPVERAAMVRPAAFVKPAQPEFKEPAKRTGLLDASLLSELSKTAEREKSRAKKLR